MKSCTDKLMSLQLMSPLDMIVLNAFLCNFEKQWLSGWVPNILSEVFERYVDDSLAALLCQSHLNDFVNYINTKQPNIKYTTELQKNNSFSFLDVKITRSNDQLVTSVLARQQLLVFFTNFRQVLCLSHTSLTYLTLYFIVHFPLLKDIFKKKKYPEFFVDKCIKNHVRKLFLPKRIIHTAVKKQALLVLSFLGPLSFEIRIDFWPFY